MAYKLLDRAKMSVSGSPGTGNITLGGALAGYQSFSQAGINNGDTFPYCANDGINWEYGIATYISAGNQLSRAVTKTSAQSASPISLSAQTSVSGCVRAEDIQIGGVTTFPLENLTDVTITSVSTNQVIGWNGTKWVNQTPSGGGATTLSALTDVNVTEGSGINGYSLTWNNATSKWVATNIVAGTGSLSAILAGGTSVDTAATSLNIVGAASVTTASHAVTATFKMASLNDVTITSLTTNQVLAWNGTAWVNTTPSGGGSALAILNNGTSVDTAAVSLNFVNATSITTASHAVTITLPTSGGGGSGYGSNFVPPVLANLTAQQNLNSATITARTTSNADMACLHVKPGAGTDGVLYCALQTSSNANWSMVTKVRTTVVGGASDNFTGAGLMVRDATTGYISAFWLTPYSTYYSFVYTLGTGGASSYATGSASGKYTMFTDDLFLHYDYTASSHNLVMSVSRNGIDKIAVYTETNITNPGYAGIVWGGVYGSLGTNSAIGPEYDFVHYFYGAAGSNGL